MARSGDQQQHRLTPDDNWIQEAGFAPDYFIPAAEDEEEDTQLEAAIDFLLGEEIISVPPESG